MEKFSEKSEARMTGRTIRSIVLTGDIKDKRILNIGSLGGWFEDRIIKEDNFKELVGLDLPGKYINSLKEKYKDEPKINFVEGDVMELPFEKNSFDVVTMWEVIEHIKRKGELFALMEINRCLRKDGMLLLSTPKSDIRSNLLDPIWYFGHRHYSIKEIKYLLSEAGFFKFEVWIYGGYYELLSMIPFYIFKHLFGREIPFKVFFDKKRKEEFEKKGFTNIFIKAIKERDS